MPSNALTSHLEQLLHDAQELDDAHSELRTGSRGRQFGLSSLNRAIIVVSVSAWESYIEELVRESLLALRPPGPPFPWPWPALAAYVDQQLARFHTPNQRNVEALLRRCLSLADVELRWTWQNCTSPQAVQRLSDALTFRHQIAHGVNPRPIIHNHYASQLPSFLRRLALRTDEAVRDHLVNHHGIVAPWP